MTQLQTRAVPGVGPNAQSIESSLANALPTNGVRREFTLPLAAWTRSDGSALPSTASGSATAAASRMAGSVYSPIVWGPTATASNIIRYSGTVPGDYNSSLDEFFLKVTARKNNIGAGAVDENATLALSARIAYLNPGVCDPSIPATGTGAVPLASSGTLVAGATTATQSVALLRTLAAANLPGASDNDGGYLTYVFDVSLPRRQIAPAEVDRLAANSLIVIDLNPSALVGTPSTGTMVLQILGTSLTYSQHANLVPAKTIDFGPKVGRNRLNEIRFNRLLPPR